MARKDKPPSPGKDARAWKKTLATFFSKALGSRANLVDILRAAESHNLIDPDALTMMEGALEVSEMQVRDIMIPRVQMVCVRHDDHPKEILKTVIGSGHSRFPVIGGDNDEITGILLAKDLLAYLAGNEDENYNIKDAMRDPVFVPESKRLNMLLREFRSTRNHMAIVIDEYSGVSGLVTIEDIIEEIIGEIEDEHDPAEKEPNIQNHSRNRFTIRALTPIEDFNEYFDTQLHNDEYDTMGGLILKAFGHLPQRGETVDFEGLNFTVLHADKRKINLLRLIRPQSSQSAHQQ